MSEKKINLDEAREAFEAAAKDHSQEFELFFYQNSMVWSIPIQTRRVKLFSNQKILHLILKDPFMEA